MAAEREPHTLAGAYVMDAVTDAERAEFDLHLAVCPECQAETRELRETAARLGMAQAMHPRNELRATVIRAAAQLTQLAPDISAEQPAPARLARRARRPLSQRLTRTRVAGASVAMTSSRRMAVAGLAAFFVAAGVVTGVMMNDTMGQLNHAQHQNHMIAAVLSAPDAVMLTARISTGGTATVVMSHREDALVFSAQGLRRLPPAKLYELWLMGKAGDRPAGMMRVAGDGMSGPAVVSGLAAGDLIGLTVEPAAGSARPTSPPVVLIPLRVR